METLRSAGPREQALHEEFANALIHGCGLAFSLIGAPFLLGAVARSHDVWLSVACTAYLVSLAAVYAASTLSHAIQHPIRKRFFEILDQATIYLLIAGTYSPYAAVYLREPSWWGLSAVMWAAAIAGFLSKAVFAHRVNGVALWLYLLLGWLPVVAAPHMIPLMSGACFQLTVLGGLCYTFGTILLAYDHAIPFLHSGWHVAVLVGSASHFFAILWHVAPAL
jgi:hemolysin III